jgi:hypothetical protein
MRLQLDTHTFLGAISYPALLEHIERVGKLLYRRHPGGLVEAAA